MGNCCHEYLEIQLGTSTSICQNHPCIALFEEKILSYSNSKSGVSRLDDTVNPKNLYPQLIRSMHDLSEVTYPMMDQLMTKDLSRFVCPGLLADQSECRHPYTIPFNNLL